MGLDVREMRLDETPLVIDYFHSSTPEHLEMLGVDPTRLPPREAWATIFNTLYGVEIEQRRGFFLIWLMDGDPIGFSSCDKIVFGAQANMHLHVTKPAERKRGIGTQCVRLSVEIYFQKLKIKQLFCEPNAFNVGPNRTLQRAGFKYVKTHMTVPGPLNFHQVVNRWLFEPPV
ncbi:GNAT family N-acetyltransferase [Bradyrhizobium liaoningense]|uniref:GNAT family N-acetyltransferase n=1 Tax=Bradyrhizobium liaoningense TaxID=43992 RepID=UPI001BA901FD|nr:GNAT family protein [Bradyrhizobium liaoningense]MBR0855594.1 GNAT family N-acetyltransferase [Bradyrhizobium liaoningense]